MNYKHEVLERIHNFDSNTVFIANDFYDIAGDETIRSILNRLVKSGDIKRILKGVYYHPKYIEIINEFEAPSANEVAHAIARKYNWTITPSGNTALNLLGLSTQVSSKWIYISDGRYADYTFENITITFKHVSNGAISNMSSVSSMVIQAIKAIGKNSITDEHIRYLKDKLSDKEKAELLESGKTTSMWIYRIIRNICGVNSCSNLNKFQKNN